MLEFKEFRRLRKEYIPEETRTACRLVYSKYIKAYKMKNITTPFNPPTRVVDSIKSDMYDTLCYPTPVIPPKCYDNSSTLRLGNCTAATPCVEGPSGYCLSKAIKTGNKPMLTNKMTSTSTDITINAPSEKSDAMIQRDFLMSEFAEKFNSWRRSDIADKLRDQFNLNAPTRPQNWADLLAAIAGGKFTFDQKKFDLRVSSLMDDSDISLADATKEISDDYGMFGFVTFTDLPKADRKGYDAAMLAFEAAKTQTKQDIMILDPKDGLAALRALEAWTPPAGAVAS